MFLDGTSEAIVDIISMGQYCWNAVSDINGRFCYPDCDVTCDGLDGCIETNCLYNQDDTKCIDVWFVMVIVFISMIYIY